MKILIDEKGSRYLLKDDQEEFHTKYGVVKLEGLKPGDKAISHTGKEFILIEPDIVDIYSKMPRSGSMMLVKDIGTIISNTGIGSGCRVLESGTGSGGLTIFLANICGPEGQVYSYELSEEASNKAKKNMEMAGLENCEFINKDINEGIKERDLDAIILDMVDPWIIFIEAGKALKLGGHIAVYNPYVEQARKTFQELEKIGFRTIRTIEVFEREMEFRPQGSRPKTQRVGHTAYLTFGRKIMEFP